MEEQREDRAEGEAESEAPTEGNVPGTERALVEMLSRMVLMMSHGIILTFYNGSGVG